MPSAPATCHVLARALVHRLNLQKAIAHRQVALDSSQSSSYLNRTSEKNMAANATVNAFALGRYRPEGTLVEADVAREPREELRLNLTSRSHVEAELRKIEAHLAHGDPEGAQRRARSLYDSEFKLPDALLGRVQFALGSCAISLADASVSSAPHKLARSLQQADRWFGFCAATLERANGPCEPSLVPCLLNRGCVLVRRGRFRTATEVLRRARHVSDGLLGGGVALRGRVLLALAAALLGCGDALEAEAAYRDALAAAEATERLGASGWHLDEQPPPRGPRPTTPQMHIQPPPQGSLIRQPQPSRAALAALLQARGEHHEAMQHLAMQRNGLRESHRRGEASGARARHRMGVIRTSLSAHSLPARPLPIALSPF